MKTFLTMMVRYWNRFPRHVEDDASSLEILKVRLDRALSNTI